MKIGINFRDTAGFVTDGQDETYCLHDGYPTTRGGATFGWESDMDAGSDRDSGVDRRLAGNNSRSTVPRSFRLDLDAIGMYRIRLAIGDAGETESSLTAVQDGSVDKFVVSDPSIASGSFQDAQGNEYTAANWPAQNQFTSVVFTGTLLRVNCMPFTAGLSKVTLAHLFVETWNQGIYRRMVPTQRMI